MNLDENDALVKALLKSRHATIEAQLQALSKYSSVTELMNYLADASPKERESFLKPWKSVNAKRGIGRKKQDDLLEIYTMFIRLKEHHKIKSDGKMYDWVIENVGKKITDVAEQKNHKKNRRNQRAGFLNKISKARKLYPFIEKTKSS